MALSIPSMTSARAAELRGVDDRPWPLLVVLAVILAGFLSPFLCFGGTVAALAFGDREQGLLMAAAGLVHIFLRMTLLPI
jgi:hypothetical protein